jgi:hypothetical protein
MAVFDFCPNSQVPETISPAAAEATSMNGWSFSARPSVPYQRKFKIKLYGLMWYLDPITGLYDELTDLTHNARVLEEFYREHLTWKEFTWTHPHIGVLNVKFAEKVDVPAGIENSGGALEGLEITLIESNPGF